LTNVSVGGKFLARSDIAMHISKSIERARMTTPGLRLVERIMGVLSGLTPSKEYPYHRARLNLGFKRVSERLPHVFPKLVDFGKFGSLMDSDAIRHAISSLDTSEFIDVMLMHGRAYIRIKPLLVRVVASDDFRQKFELADIRSEDLAEAAKIVEQALEDVEIPTEELIVRR